MNMKKAFAVAIIISMCLSTLIFPVSAAAKTDIVRDDLVVWYDASNNSNGLQDYETTVWKDLTGNGNHMTVLTSSTAMPTPLRWCWVRSTSPLPTGSR